MKRFRIATISVGITIALFLINVSALARTSVSDLKCEYHINPIGIDVQTPRLTWKLVSDELNVVQTAYEIRVATSHKSLQSGKGLLWSSGKIASQQSVNVEYGGEPIKSMQRVYWQLRVWDQNNKPTQWSDVAYWETGILDQNLWKATWITRPNDDVNAESRPSPLFRKEFSLNKKIESARVYVSALGLYELSINGQKVGNDHFTPGWTSYNKRVQYQTYDVTSLLKNQNAIGAIVGDGWYRGNIGWSGQRNYYGPKTALFVQLQINYSDGSSDLIISDESWKVSTGPILESDIYNGEVYDARLEQSGWNLSGFDDSHWTKPESTDFSAEKLIAPQGLPVRIMSQIKPVAILTTPKGETILDMGQNMVGHVRLKVKGNAGDKVTLKFAEVLDKDGNFYTANLRSAKATNIYLLKGGEEEIYEPHFTFFGFRYVKVEGYPGELTPEAITGMVIHSNMKKTGSFACSDTLINKLQSNIEWGQRGNFLDVPTDCPQRDERMGWTGDAQVFSPTAAFNFDVAAFFTKWMGDVAADQLPGGSVPYVIPDVLRGGGGSTAWADVAIIVPWNIYLAYGDKRILEVQYESMKGWVDYMSTRAGSDLIWTGDFHFGDWLAFATTRSDYPGATTEKDLIATAYFRYSAQLLSKIASIIGKTDDSKAYNELSEKVKTAFIHEYVTPSGRLVSHTQTAYSLALAFDLLPEELIPAAAKYLADDVRNFGHLTTGFVGTPLLCNVLSDNGYPDLAFMLVNRKEYPSWLYPVTQGATTIWERWDGQKPDGTFQDVGMNSFNHYAYGAIGEWLYTYVAGIVIDPENPGYKHFFLNPHPGGGLNDAKAELETLYGKISSSWKISGADFEYDIIIPANTNALVTLPNAKLNEVKIDGTSLLDLRTLIDEVKDNNITLKLGSGKYNIRYKLAD
jgi:alpha-L-rhamnosidase